MKTVKKLTLAIVVLIISCSLGLLLARGGGGRGGGGFHGGGGFRGGGFHGGGRGTTATRSTGARTGGRVAVARPSASTIRPSATAGRAKYARSRSAATSRNKAATRAMSDAKRHGGRRHHETNTGKHGHHHNWVGPYWAGGWGWGWWDFGAGMGALLALSSLWPSDGVNVTIEDNTYALQNTASREELEDAFNTAKEQIEAFAEKQDALQDEQEDLRAQLSQGVGRQDEITAQLDKINSEINRLNTDMQILDSKVLKPVASKLYGKDATSRPQRTAPEEVTKPSSESAGWSSTEEDVIGLKMFHNIPVEGEETR